MKNTNEVTLTKSELEYVETCYNQFYKDAYKTFEDYLKVAIDGKRICGTIYN